MAERTRTWVTLFAYNLGKNEVPMAWKGVTIMDQRVRFIAEYLDGYFAVAELCLIAEQAPHSSLLSSPLVRQAKLGASYRVKVSIG